MDCNSLPFILTIFIFLLQYSLVALSSGENGNESQLQTLVSVEDYGQIQGSIMTTIQGKEFVAFRGIRYAAPPIGDLRFKSPEPFKSNLGENDVFDATRDGADCLQLNMFGFGTSGQEDCLFLNIYTPNATDNIKRPVMVFIHGGGFSFCSGSSEQVGPRKILNHDVVLVSMNYRLNIFGFFSTGDENAPGNYGFLDQVEALKWVNKNIHTFGGDPDQVTIFGISAGGACVYYHMLSPLSKGIFHRAIPQSGNPLSRWAFMKNLLPRAHEIADVLGCPTGSSFSLVNCLRHLSEDELIDSLRQYRLFFFPFGPTVDNHFLLDEPKNLLATGQIANQVPIVTGVTKNEGSTFYKIAGKPDLINASNEDIVNIIIQMLHTPSKDVPANVKEAIINHYFKDVDKTDPIQVRNTIIDALSHTGFDSPHYETVLALIDAGLHPYVYSYDYKKLNANGSGLNGIPAELGVGHGEDMYFLFDSNEFFPSFSDIDDPESNRILDMWINFAKFGDPTPTGSEEIVKWPSAQNNSVPIYRINIPSSVEYYNPDEDEDRKFWMEELFPQLSGN